MVQMLGALGVAQSPLGTAPQSPLSGRDLQGCLAIQGRDPDASRTEVLRQSLARTLEQFQPVRDLEIDDTIPPALIFRPRQAPWPTN